MKGGFFFNDKEQLAIRPYWEHSPPHSLQDWNFKEWCDVDDEIGKKPRELKIDKYEISTRMQFVKSCFRWRHLDLMQQIQMLLPRKLRLIACACQIDVYTCRYSVTLKVQPEPVNRPTTKWCSSQDCERNSTNAVSWLNQISSSRGSVYERAYLTIIVKCVAVHCAEEPIALRKTKYTMQTRRNSLASSSHFNTFSNRGRSTS